MKKKPGGLPQWRSEYIPPNPSATGLQLLSRLAQTKCTLRAKIFRNLYQTTQVFGIKGLPSCGFGEIFEIRQMERNKRSEKQKISSVCTNYFVVAGDVMVA